MKNAAVHIVCRFLCERKTSAPLSKSQGVRALGHVVTVRFVMQQTAKLPSPWLDHFAFRQQRMKVPVAPTLPAFGDVSVLGFGHSGRCGGASRFNLHLPDGTGSGASFHMLVASCTSTLVMCP